MKTFPILLLSTLLLFAFSAKSQNKTTAPTDEEHIGLMVIDAQKWFIPGHPESVYTLWNITGHDRTSESIISSMDSVLAWANQRKLPVFVTYEGSDTGRYDLPQELLEDLDSSRTTHFVKLFYGAPKHEVFNRLIQQAKINRWILIGAETDVCVYQTAKELLKQHKHVTLVNEAVYSGRNNTEVSRNNLRSFGAHFISLKDLYLGKNLFLETQPQVEAPFDFDNTVLTVFTHSGQTNTNNGDSKRLDYLMQYAKITGLKTEHPNAVSKGNKTRLIAGYFSPQQYDALKKQTNDQLIVIADCTPALLTSDIPKAWRVHTLKTVFYELMETAAFYAKPVDELEGWQKELKKALLEERLGYVETLQNE